MAHYATLHDYHFTDDVDDIRGSNLYSADNKKLGKVVDVVFDHSTGEIRYLVADIGADRRVLVPSNHLYRSLADEEDFETDISAAELEHLPRFDENTLGEEKNWRAHDEEHRRVWKEQEERLLREYKEKWEDGPVAHREGSDRLITPDEPVTESAEAIPAANRDRIITGADLTPHRIAGKFPGADPMVNPGTPDAGKETLHPTVDRSLDATHFGGAPPSPRWHSFQENIRHNLDDIRGHCSTCCQHGESKVA